MDSVLASHPVTPGLILGVHKRFYVDVAAQLRTEDKGLIMPIKPICVLANGKLIRQKSSLHWIQQQLRKKMFLTEKREKSVDHFTTSKKAPFLERDKRMIERRLEQKKAAAAETMEG